MTTTTARTLHNHIVTTARTHNVVIEWCATYCAECYFIGPHANSERRHVHVPPVTDFRAYAISLHELGHLVADGGLPTLNAHGYTSGSAKRRAEAVAWKWAMEHAVCWTAEMTTVRDKGLESYNTNIDGEPLMMTYHDFVEIMRGF